MTTRRSVIVTLFVFLVAVWGAPVNAAPAPVGSGVSAQEFIEGLAEEAVRALTTKGVSREDRLSRFSELLHNNFDVQTIGKWVLGRYWRTASDEEKSTYLELFEEYVAITYVERFDQYSGEKLLITRAVAEPGKDALVFSEINRPTDGQPIRVDWRVRSHADIYKIIDVYVEGISMSQTQRKEFTSVIRANGGTVTGLIKVLRAQIDKLNN